MKRHLRACIAMMLLPLMYNAGLAQSGARSYRPDARAAGLGGSLVAQSHDPAAIFWNPALLAGLKTSTFIATINDPFEFDLLAVSHYVPNFGTFGLGLVRLPGVPGGVDRGSIAWGRSLNQWLSLGGNLNLEKSAGNWFGSADWGAFIGNADIGTPGRGWYRRPDLKLLDRVGLGMTIQGIPLSSSSVQTAALFGVSYIFPLTGVLLNAGYHVQEGENTTHVGFGLQFPGRVSVFAGIEDLDFAKVALGAGYRFNLLTLNLGYSASSERLLFTISTRLGPSRKRLASPHLQEGVRFIRAGRYSKASKSLKKYLSYDLADSKSDSVRQIIFALDRRASKIGTAVDSLLSVAKILLDPDDPKFLRAALVYARVLELNPNNGEAGRQLGTLNPAIAAFAKKTGEQAILKFESGQFVAARKLFNRILMLDKENATADYYITSIDKILADRAHEYFLRGVGFFKQENYNEALTQFELTLQMAPEKEGLEDYLRNTKQRISDSRSRVDDMFDEARRFELAGQDVQATNRYLAILDLEKGNLAARESIDRLRPKVVKFVNRRYRQGEGLYGQGDLLGSRKILNEVLSIDPGHRPARRALSKVGQAIRAKIASWLIAARDFQEKGDLPKALGFYSQTLELEPGNAEALKGKQRTEEAAEIRKLVSEARRKAGSNKFNEALAILQSALVIAPEDARVKRELEVVNKRRAKEIATLFDGGIVFYTQDKFQDAQRVFKRVLELDAGHVGALKYLQQAEEAMLAIKRLN